MSQNDYCQTQDNHKHTYRQFIVADNADGSEGISGQFNTPLEQLQFPSDLSLNQFCWSWIITINETYFVIDSYHMV